MTKEVKRPEKGLERTGVGAILFLKLGSKLIGDHFITMAHLLLTYRSQHFIVKIKENFNL